MIAKLNDLQNTIMTIQLQDYQLYFTDGYKFLNEACAGLQPAHAWFLRITSICECLYACVCPPPRL